LPRRDEMQRLILPPKIWKLSSTRPANHPQRRLAALATIAREWSAFRRSLGKRSPKAVERFLDAIDHPFWKLRYTLSADPAQDPMALIGESRVAEILANVIFPFWRTEDHDAWLDYVKLSARLTNRRIETATTRLFGDDPRRREFARTVVHQQALLQIYEDFCLQDNSDCAHCPFPEQMKNW